MIQNHVISAQKYAGGAAKEERIDQLQSGSAGNRVLVLSKRPATIKSVVDISFPDNASPLERRNFPEFKKQKLWLQGKCADQSGALPHSSGKLRRSCVFEFIRLKSIYLFPHSYTAFYA